MSKNTDSPRDEHRPNVKLYMLVFGALLVLTLVTVAISKIHLPRPQAIALGLFVALVKASLVGALFMHLWGENKLIHKFLFVTLACAAILVLPLIDGVLLVKNLTAPIAVAGQHPAEHSGQTEAK